MIKPGDWVRRKGGRTSLRVVEPPSGTPPWAVKQLVWVLEPGAMHSESEPRHLVELLCPHCQLPRVDHANGGKCLYEPTSWEEA